MKKILMMASLMTMTLVFISSASVFAQAIDVSGRWNMKVETAAGPRTPVFVLKQSGELITGTYTGQMGEFPVKGTIKDKEIRLEFKAGEIGVVYTGTVDGNTMKGKVIFGDLGEGSFAGAKEVR
jgi:hypothetical protein